MKQLPPLSALQPRFFPASRFLAGFFLGATLVSLRLSATETALPVTHEVLDTKVISHQPQYYDGWPTIAIREGKLMLVYSGGREDHVCPFGRLECMVSSDGGNSWAWPQILFDSAIDDRDSGILVTQRGTILVPVYSSLAYQIHYKDQNRRMKEVFGNALALHMERWRIAELRTTDAEKEKLRGPRMIRSTDGGITWSAAYTVPCFSPHGPAQLADGRILYAGANGKKAGAWISNDDGLTWDLLSDLPLRAGEIHAVEAADGTLIVQVRDKKPAPAAPASAQPRTVGKSVEQGSPTINTGITQTESKDGGRTWTSPHEIGVTGYPSHLVRLKDDVLLMTYGMRKKPLGIRAKTSKDHGQTWGPEMILTSDGVSDDLGYPSTAQLPDGTLVTVWYEERPGSHNAVLRQAKWKLR